MNMRFKDWLLSEVGKLGDPIRGVSKPTQVGSDANSIAKKALAKPSFAGQVVQKVQAAPNQATAKKNLMTVAATAFSKAPTSLRTDTNPAAVAQRIDHMATGGKNVEL